MDSNTDSETGMALNNKKKDIGLWKVREDGNI